MFSNKTKIKNVKAREILDSRGNPTVEVEVETGAGKFCAGVPSGASTGSYEAVELRDKDNGRYAGLGVLGAVRNVNDIIAPMLRGKDCRDQIAIDGLMSETDGTPNFARLGANAACGVSLAVCRAAAGSLEIPLYKYVGRLFGSKEVVLPTPCFNVVNGGAHAGNDLDVQEFMIVPQGAVYKEKLRTAAEVYKLLKKILVREFGKSAGNLGDEGGFAPNANSADQVLGLLMQAVAAANAGGKVKFIMDVAASQFYKEGLYQMRAGAMDGAALGTYYQGLISRYPIIGIEDPFAEDDWASWSNFKFGCVIGDDLLVTNSIRIKEAHEKNACNAMILKINQVGTLTLAMDAAKLAKSYGWKIMVSHRSGETNDDFIADFAAGIAADFIKTGAPARGERLAKYNRLAKIEEELGA